MNKIALLILAGTVALLTESCSFFSDFADSRKELEKEAAKPIPVNVSPVQADTPEEEFADLEFEDEPLQTIAGLIPATNPETRVRSSIRGRQDPFSVVSLKPSIEIEKEEIKQASSNSRNNNSGRNRNVVNNNRPTNNNDDLLSPPQAAFEPTLAQSVVISGLYEAGGRTKLIVQAPEENTSRYVEVGQYLSNGQILVKSIDRNHFPTPMVILEQSGVEVSKVIGKNDAESNISSLPPANSRNTAMLSNVSLN